MKMLKELKWEAILTGVLYILLGIVALVGLIGIINELTNFLGKLTLLELVIFLGSFLWFQNSLKTAREKFLHI